MSFVSISHVSSTKFTIINPISTATILIPSTVITGHDLYVAVCSRDHWDTTAYVTVTDTDSAGNTFSLIGNSTNRKANLFYKKATSATASKLITVAGGKLQTAAGLSVYSGGISGDPTTNWATHQGLTTDYTQAGFTPDYDGSMVCAAVFNWTDNISISTLTAGNPTSLTTRYDCQSDNATDDCSVMHASAIQPGTRASTGTFQWPQDSRTKESMVWAIRPALAIGSGTTQNPVKTYSAAGTYIARLTVTDSLGLSSSTTKAVTV